MRLIICGGGTGGHLFPGVAVAEEFQRCETNGELLYVHTGRPTDERVMAGEDFASEPLACQGLKGMGPIAKMRSMLCLPASVVAAFGIIRRFKPDVILGVGGYVTGPMLLAARLRGVPVAIHEQNSVPGLANRLLAPLVQKVFISIPASADYFEGRDILLTGNPVRREVCALAGAEKEEKHLTLLVMGGSLGAHAINEMMAAGAGQLQQVAPKGLRIIHQTGQADVEMVKKAYAEAGLTAEVAAFFDDMPRQIAKADLVVARAGATTIAELSAMGRAMILIPYPHAADDHQLLNGSWLVEAGGASLLEEKGLTAERLLAEVERLLGDEGARGAMARSARKLGRPLAARRIVEECLKLAS
ncbi:MAG: undecaprenyldiphospho-muramoylpentapeptide beta-N-acetylglucosaminyltransferase [Thermodesulfobacteriota bacterium]